MVVQAMTSLIVLALHLLGDFILQSHKMAMFKLVDWKWRTAHVFVYIAGFAAYGCLVGWPHWTIPAIFVAHWITDCRRWCSGKDWPPKPIVVDQSLHVIQLALILAWAGVK